MAKFKNLITGAILETDNEQVVADFKANKELYSPLSGKSEKDEKEEAQHGKD